MYNYLQYGSLVISGVIAAPRIINHTLLFGILLVEYSLNTLKDPNEFPPATRIQYANNYFKGLFYGFGQIYNMPFNYCDLTIPRESDSDTAILLIHGLGRNVGDWNWLRKQFEPTNSWIYTVALSSLDGIDVIAQERIAPKIAEIKKQSGCKHIILIGASMGGLVASYYKENLDNDNSIKGVITLGSPFYGTRIAAARTGTCSRQMCPDSNFLESLLSKINEHPEFYYQVASKFDEVVFPWNSALLKNSDKSQQFILSFEGHLGLLHNNNVAAQLSQWVTQIQQLSREQASNLNKPLLFKKINSELSSNNTRIKNDIGNINTLKMQHSPL